MREKIDVVGRIHVPRSADWANRRRIPLPIIAANDNFLPFSSTFSPLKRFISKAEEPLCKARSWVKSLNWAIFNLSLALTMG